MAQHPTVEESERFILDIYSKKPVREGEMLLLGVFQAALSNSSSFRAEDLKSGFESLIKKGMVREQDNKFFLTELGFQAM